VATTQVEIGQYLTNDIFATLLWRPMTTGTSRLAALRVETRLSDRWTLEGFWEDRLLRNQLFQVPVADRGFEVKWVYGFFLYREWGY